MRQYNFKKAIQTANFFIKLDGGSMEKLKLVKLIWLVDRYHLLTEGRPITYDRYFALEYGPVPSFTLNLISANTDYLPNDFKIDGSFYRDIFLTIDPVNNRNIQSIKNPDLKVFSQSDREAIRLIYEKFGELSSSQLSTLSHEFPEWKKWKSKLSDPEEGKRFLMSYEDFFDLPPKGVCNLDAFQMNLDARMIQKEYFLEDNFLSTLI